MSEEASAGEHRANIVRWSATVDQVNEHTVLLDLDGVLLKLPREVLGVAGQTVREGDGFAITIEPTSTNAEALRRSIEARQRALVAASPGHASQTPAAPGSPVGLGTMPLGSDGSNEPAIDLHRDDVEPAAPPDRDDEPPGGGDGST